ncbi:MAG: Hsp20/alpha crystallin family protein [Spirochaetes bacterium]|nr:MAG: Hsp20/alpha crystallin family protein [Spirochaetota bacterium]
MTIQPLSNIYEEKGDVIVKVEMPGVSKNNIDISIDGQNLIISGQRESLESEGEFLLRERRIADYYKVFTLDETVDRDKIDATMENGVLTLKLQLKESVKPKKIEVKSS